MQDLRSNQSKWERSKSFKQPAPALPLAKFFFLVTRPPWSLCFHNVFRGVRGYMRPYMRPYSRLLRNPGPRQAPQPPPALPPAKFFFSCDQTPMKPLFLQRFQGGGYGGCMRPYMVPCSRLLRNPGPRQAPQPPPAPSPLQNPFFLATRPP